MSELFTRYRISIRFTAKLMGGTPKDPRVIEGWIKTRMGLEQGDQLRQMVVRTLRDLGHDLIDDPTPEQVDEAIKATVGDKSTVGFKRDARGLFIEGRQIKAALKESTAILFPYATDKWGATKKAPKAYLAERVFCEEDTIPLGRDEPDGLEMFIGHVSGPQGPRSTLTYVEYCERPPIGFTVWSLEDAVKHQDWEAIFEHMEQNGLGALRSQGHGRFTVTGVELLPSRQRPKFFSFEKPKLKVVEDAAD
jgi:hypothetical protein